MNTPTNQAVPPDVPKRRMSPAHRAIAGAAILIFFCLTLAIVGVSFFVSGEVKRQVAAVAEKQQQEPIETVYVQPKPDPGPEPGPTPEQVELERLAAELSVFIDADYPNDATLPVSKREEYAFPYLRIKDYWGDRNAITEIGRACDRVYLLKKLYPKMTALYVLQSFSEEIPDTVIFEEQTTAEGVAVHQRSTEAGGGKITSAVRVDALTQARLRVTAENILTVADRIYARLEDNYYAPIIAAQEEADAIAQANAEQIAANQENARNRGMSNNRAKADASAAAARQQQQFRDNKVEWNRQQEIKQRAAGIIR